MALQKSLMAMGINPGAPDGIFGRKTEDAVKQVQERAGITADGIWGPDTQAAFDDMRAKMSGGTEEETGAGIQDMLQPGRTAAESAPDKAPDLPELA